MTSQSPLDPSETAQTEKYQNAWEALSHLILVEGQSWSGKEKNCVYLNLGPDRAFANVSAVSAIDYPDDSRAVAVTDWDDDGRLDLVLKNRTGPRLRLLRNRDGGAAHFLTVDLVGVRCNRDAVGAHVVAELDGRTLRRTLYAGDGYLSQSSKRLHFGLGEATAVRKLTVQWPDGSVQSFENLAADGRYRIVQGASQPTAVKAATATQLAAVKPEALPADSSGSIRAALVDKLPLAELALPRFDAAGSRRVADFAGQPVLINLWATWCSNCMKELEAFRARAADIQASGVRIVAMSTDDAADREQARTRIAEFGLQADAGFADERFVQALQAVMSELCGTAQSAALPTSLLLDATGQVVLVYQGPVDVDRLLRDVATVKTMDPKQRGTPELAGGRWTAQYRRDFAHLADELGRLGLTGLATYYRGFAERDAAGVTPGR